MSKKGVKDMSDTKELKEVTYSREYVDKLERKLEPQL